MRFHLDIDMDNAAFDDQGGDTELRMIFYRLAKRFDEGKIRNVQGESRVLDSNGDTVGSYHFDN